MKGVNACGKMAFSSLSEPSLIGLIERHWPALLPWLQLMRLDRPVGAVLLLWPTLWAVWIAATGHPSVKNVVIFTLGVFVTRAAGCVMNDIADRNFDGHVKRTANRPLASGKLSVKQALGLFVVLMLLALVLVLFLKWQTFLLALVAVGLIIAYPFAKRVTQLPQVVLGAAFSWGIPMAFMETTGKLPAACWLIFTANLLWTVMYDTQYAMCDRDDDLKIGIKSTAILFGDADRVILGILQAMTLGTLLLLGNGLQLGWPWLAGLATMAACFVWQQTLTWERERLACFLAFRTNQLAGAFVFAGLIAAYQIA
jgi:4-hydroxybenzoate polyprenyltransferase